MHMLKKACPIILVFLLLASLVAVGQTPANTSVITPRLRVIVDNDFSGDPDGLFQLAHLVLSPSVDIRAIIGSHLKVGDGFDNSTTQADNAVKKARELLQVMAVQRNPPIIAGSNTGMLNDSTPVKSDAVNFIIKEALRTDTQ